MQLINRFSPFEVAVLLVFGANLDFGIGRLQLVEPEFKVEPEVEGDSLVAT